MVDRAFFILLLPLPVIAATGAVLYALAAWRTKTPRLRRSRLLGATWLGLSSLLMFYARERVRNWADFDNAFAATVLISFAGLGVLLGATVGFFALLGRSTRGTGLCPRCWYDMTGVSDSDESTCPECGLVVLSQADFVRRKRWPILIALAVVVQLAGQFTYQLVRADHAGVNAFVPTIALVAGMYSLPRETILGNGSLLDTETLTGRLLKKDPTEWQRSWALAKAVGGLAPGSSRETVLRAASILFRCGYEGEIPLEHWQSAVRLLSAPGDGASEGLTYLTESYVRSRTDGVYVRLAPPIDRELCEKEIAPIAPALFALLKDSRPRTSEWWNAAQLLALTGTSAPGLVEYLESRVLLEDSDNARGSAAVALAALFDRSPGAAAALTAAVGSLEPVERSRVLISLSRNAPDHPDLLQAFRAMATCGEPALENIGAGGLATARSTRCEGVARLIDNFARHQRWGMPDIWALYWPILRGPDDSASDQLVAFLQDVAIGGAPDLRDDAMSVLAAVGRSSESRNVKTVAFCDLLALDTNRINAEKARGAAKDLRALSAAIVPRKVAAIR